MGRSLKKRKLKKTKRVKVIRPESTEKTKKKGMKTWEWWLIGIAFILAIVFLIMWGKSNPYSESLPPVPTPTATVDGS
ncbi:hypothetical protein JW979_03770 [bacterium]|nr:hypothetical protein [candidate division CSSED10-310 bacterium]